MERAEKRNALNAAMVASLKENFNQASTDDACKVVVLRAEGKVFSAGADLAYLQALQSNSYEDNLKDSGLLRDLFRTIYRLPKVVIAEIQGHAIAGGCGLASVCDLSFASSEARFGYSEVKIGFVPAIVMVFLIRKIGEARAKDLLLSGRLIDAQEAVEMGMINYLSTPQELGTRVREYAKRLCMEASADSLQRTKKMIAEIQDRELEGALEYAAEQNAKARESKDCKRGIAAFLNKEKILW